MKIKLSQGKLAIIDREDYEKVSKHKWYCGKFGKHFYAVSHEGDISILMHRLILDARKGQLVDHKNQNGLDNRRKNLRFCTRAQNEQNAPYKKNNKIGLKGVCFDKRSGLWISQLSLSGKFLLRKCFPCPMEAAKAYDVAAKKYYGKFAYLNFPEK